MQVTVACSGCCTGGGGGGGNQPGCPPGASCKVDPKGDHGQPDTDHCVSSAGYSIIFTSQTGAGCLCGYPELIDVSNPPKKYRIGKSSGTTSGDLFNVPDCTGFNHSDSCTFGTTCKYDKTTCAFTTSGSSQCQVAGSPLPPFDSCGPDTASCNFSVTTTRTSTTLVATGACCGPESLQYRKAAGTRKWTLSDEDTLADALLRSGPTTGEASFAIVSSFDPVSYCFIGQTSHWVVSFTGLNPACSYRFTVTYVRDTAGGGTETLTEETDFSSEASTYILEGDVPAVVDFNTQFAGSLLQFT